MNLFKPALLSVLVSASTLFASQVSAFAVWAVEGDADANTNTAGSILNLTPGVNQIDLYFDTGLDSSIGWDITLEVVGSGSISNIAGGDINGGLGTAIEGGFRQLGGNPAITLASSSQLLFSLTFDAVEGDTLRLLGSSQYTSGSLFQTVSIDSVDLVTAAVPIPASGIFMMSSLFLLAARKLSFS